MGRKIRAAVIGLGRLGYWHAVNTATRIREVDLAAVCNTNIEIAEKVARELDVPFFTVNADDIFNDDSIEAVIIATPTSTHFELLKKASEAGKAIFVEKPLTINLHEAKRIQSVIQENKTMCQVGFMRRFDSAYEAAKKRIDSGDIGKPIYFKGIGRDPQALPEKFVKQSGGIFIDVAIHDFDIARYLMKSEVTSVFAHGRVLKNPFLEKYGDVDQSITYMEFASGAAGDVEASRNAFFGYDVRAEIIGTEGTILIGGLRQNDIKILSKTGAAHDILPDFPERFNTAYYNELSGFFRSILDKEHPLVTVEDGVKALEIAAAAKESFKSGTAIKLF